jgi:23S rRNA (uridine2552-2'-O)-methyltransferase
LAPGKPRMKRKNKWKDHYSRRAREEKWLARSIYKLEEIDKKYSLIRPGFRLLDLGCYPGSWSQYCIKKVGKTGEVMGLDTESPDHISSENFRFIEADVLKLEIDWLAREAGKTDAVISDLAPKTTGIRLVDTTQSLNLAEKALDITLAVLKEKGNFLCKVFEGEDFNNFRDRVAGCFEQIRVLRPAAVRKGSREVFVLGLTLVK